MDNSGSTVPYTPAAAQPPQAKKHPVTRCFHGRDFVDNYEWLRDKEAEETLAYLKAENAYTDAQTEHLTGLRDNIYSEITSRIKQTDMSVRTTSSISGLMKPGAQIPSGATASVPRSRKTCWCSRKKMSATTSGLVRRVPRNS